MRRSGVSLKISDSSSCNICKNVQCEYTCLICKKKLCEYCICDENKYCIMCVKKINNSTETIIRVPTSIDSTNYIVIKKRKMCCFM